LTNSETLKGLKARIKAEATVGMQQKYCHQNCIKGSKKSAKVAKK
jgi:hypothetical protein